MEKNNQLRVEQYDVAQIATKKKILKKVATGVGTAALAATLGSFQCLAQQKQEPETVWEIIEFMGGPASWYDSEPIPIIEPEDFIFDVVEEMPSFPGGFEAMHKFIRENMQYPELAREHGIQGRVPVQFVVERDGSITDIVVLRDVDPTLDREAIRLVESMPEWIPGRNRGREVRVRFILPINFRLD